MTAPKQISVDELIERFRLAAEEWGKLEAEAQKLEHMRKIVRGQIYCMLEGSIGDKEHQAEAHPDYKAHIDRMTEARTAANVARARKDALHMRFEAYRTRSANRRIERQG